MLGCYDRFCEWKRSKPNTSREREVNNQIWRQKREKINVRHPARDKQFPRRWKTKSTKSCWPDSSKEGGYHFWDTRRETWVILRSNRSIQRENTRGYDRAHPLIKRAWVLQVKMILFDIYLYINFIYKTFFIYQLITIHSKN